MSPCDSPKCLFKEDSQKSLAQHTKYYNNLSIAKEQEHFFKTKKVRTQPGKLTEPFTTKNIEKKLRNVTSKLHRIFPVGEHSLELIEGQAKKVLLIENEYLNYKI